MNTLWKGMNLFILSVWVKLYFSKEGFSMK